MTVWAIHTTPHLLQYPVWPQCTQSIEPSLPLFLSSFLLSSLLSVTIYWVNYVAGTWAGHRSALLLEAIRGKRPLFCIPCGPMNSVFWDDGMWLRVFLQSYKDRPNSSHKLLESTVLMTLSYRLAAPHPFSSCSVLPVFSEDLPPLILDSSGPGWPAPELLSSLPSLQHISILIVLSSQ